MCESVCLSLFVAVVAPTKKGRKKKKKKCHTFIFDFRFFLVPGGCSKNVKIIPFSTANHTNRAERCINAATRGSPGFYVMQTRCSLHVQNANSRLFACLCFVYVHANYLEFASGFPRGFFRGKGIFRRRFGSDFIGCFGLIKCDPKRRRKKMRSETFTDQRGTLVLEIRGEGACLTNPFPDIS